MPHTPHPTTLILPNPQTLGTLQPLPDPAPFTHAAWHLASAESDGLLFTFPPNTLSPFAYLTTDLLLAGNQSAVFQLDLAESPAGPTLTFRFSLLNQCQARLRMPLSAVNQNTWGYPRKGALLKPMCDGDRVDLARVTRLTFKLLRKGPAPVRFAMTPLTATTIAPPLLESPLLPVGPLLDDLGQSTLHDWPAKTRSPEQLVARLQQQSLTAPQAAWPASFSTFGGYNSAPTQKPTGFFRTYFDPSAKRWWLLDPAGHLFWSNGVTCVGPRAECNFQNLTHALAWLPDPNSQFAPAFSKRGGHTISYLNTNLIRAFGQDWHPHWARIALSQLRSMGLNTIANWSDWSIGQRTAPAGGFPYTRPLNTDFPTTPTVYRDFPDVFHPNFKTDCTSVAQQLTDTASDPYLLGYFLGNEPHWGFASETPAAGMLFNTPTCHTRQALANFLKLKYATDSTLSSVWQIPTTLAAIAAGPFTHALTPPAQNDLADFSTEMVHQLYSTLTHACKQVDPNHLNLGARYYTVPPDWALAGMTCFDVFSLNAYSQKIPGDKYQRIATTVHRPVLAGEWHFGALDVGLPASGIGHVPNQSDRGRAYRVYLEDAAAHPACVGVHYFQMYDQSALGRFDGENYNIGLVDITNRPYAELSSAIRTSSERLYQVALHQLPPYADAPTYLPKLFI